MRFRIALPAVFGVVAAVLIFWDIYNQRVIESVGMGWDTGAPVWPYQASYLLLSAINAPAFALAAPLFLLPHLGLVEMRYSTLFPAILLWWWWVGTRIDYGILGSRHYRRPIWSATLASCVSAGFVLCGGWSIWDEVHRWLRYPATHPLFLLGAASVAAWCFILAGVSLVAARRLMKRLFPGPIDQRQRSKVLGYGVGVTVTAALVTSLVGVVREPRADPDSCVVSEVAGCIHGTVVDEKGGARKGVQIEILPAENRDESRWTSFRSEWTDSDGRFSVDRLDPGRYLVAVHYNYAPYASHPFAKMFYPGVETETAAERVVVNGNRRAILGPFRLRSLSLTTVQIQVVWPDGSRPKRSNLLFHNLSYPHQAVIGDVAPQVDDGIGDFEAPSGFDYSVSAQVACDGAKVIETRESKEQMISIRAGASSGTVTLTIPGPPCKLFHH